MERRAESEEQPRTKGKTVTGYSLLIGGQKTGQGGDRAEDVIDGQMHNNWP
jgi:hypothetical protein